MKACLRILPLVILVTFALSPATLEAKGGGKITGRISSLTGDGVFGALITVFREHRQGGTISFTRSDRRGNYAIANLAPGSYYLQVTREGYQPMTSSNVKIDASRTITFNVILQEFVDLLSADPDPRNWDLKTVVRSTSDRRLIFRDLPATSNGSETETPFFRSGTVNVASSAGTGSDLYSVFPSNGRNAVISNFALTEPMGDHGRLIFSGQISSGYDSFWHVRQTYNYRPDSGRDLKLSVGYGRLNLNGSSIGTMERPAQFFSRDPSLRESGIQTLDVGFGARHKLLETFDVEYGFDLSRMYYGPTKSFFSPYFQLIVTPAGTWIIKTSIVSKRISDNNSLILPDGELWSLAEPTYIANIDGEVQLSQFRHSELSVGKSLSDETTAELAVYQDRMVGPGTPFMVTITSGQSGKRTQLAQLREDQTAQRGIRFAVNHRILDFLKGSIAYVYGTGANISSSSEKIPSEILARRLLDYMRQSYYHTFTSHLNAQVPWIGTNFAVAFRWYPQSSLTPIDYFADRTDVLTKGVNFFLRQPLPVPDFLGTTGKWEALVDLRNLFNQGSGILYTSDGKLVLARNPRALRFGINLNLY